MTELLELMTGFLAAAAAAFGIAAAAVYRKNGLGDYYRLKKTRDSVTKKGAVNRPREPYSSHRTEDPPDSAGKTAGEGTAGKLWAKPSDIFSVTREKVVVHYVETDRKG